MWDINSLWETQESDWHQLISEHICRIKKKKKKTTMICMISRIVRLNTEEAYSNIVLDILSINGYEVSIFVASCVLSSTKFIWSSALHSWMHWPMFTTILESLLCHRHLHFRQLPAGILNTCFYVPLSSSLLVMVLLRFFMAIILPQNVIVAIACNSE